MDLCERLKKARENTGLSQQEVADSLGITRQSISKWERGVSYPDINNLILLKDLYNTSFDDLLIKEDTEKNTDNDLNKGDNQNKLFNITLEEIGVLIVVMCLSTIPCLGLIGILLLLGYCSVKKYKFNTFYKIILTCFVLISIYNSFVYIKIEFLDIGEATIEKVAFH